MSTIRQEQYVEDEPVPVPMAMVLEDGEVVCNLDDTTGDLQFAAEARLRYAKSPRKHPLILAE